MDLFEYMKTTNLEKESPLAARLRPQTLEEVVGQSHIIGKDKLLYRAIKADKISSIIFYGPPGTGKTTLAKVIANTTSAEFTQINATVAGKKDMEQVCRKIASTGNRRIVLCERGSSFGYRNLVADMRSLLVMRELGCPVVMDATHSVQRPGGLGTGSGGDGKYAPALARAAVATGVDGVFMETHLNPKVAKSDAANAIRFAEIEKLWKTLLKIHEVVEG